MNKDNLWQGSLINKNACLIEAIKNLNKSKLQITLVVDENNILLGTLTDGDIRRALSSGFQLNASISDVFNPNPIVAEANLSRNQALEIMKKNMILHLPIVDKEKKIVGMYLAKEMLVDDQLNNVLVILAGGKGKRMMPLSEKLPKPLIKINGKSMLEHIIENAKNQGISEFIIIVNHFGEQIINYFQNGKKLGVSIKYVFEKKPMGTAGGLYLIDDLPSQSMIVMNGDIISDIRFSGMLKFHKENNATATMATSIYKTTIPFGVIRTNGIEIESIEEKPSYINNISAGIYIIDPNFFRNKPKPKYLDMPDLFMKIKSEGYKTISYSIIENWSDIGSPEKLNEISNKLSNVK